MVKAYIVAVENEAIDNKRQTPELLVWLEWVKKKTDWFDPLVNGADEWLANIDPSSLLFPEESKPSAASIISIYNEEQPIKKRGWPLLPWYLKK